MGVYPHEPILDIQDYHLTIISSFMLGMRRPSLCAANMTYETPSDFLQVYLGIKAFYPLHVVSTCCLKIHDCMLCINTAPHCLAAENLLVMLKLRCVTNIHLFPEMTMS